MSYLSKIYSLKSEEEEIHRVLSDVEDKMIGVLDEVINSGNLDEAIHVYFAVEDILPLSSPSGAVSFPSLYALAYMSQEKFKHNKNIFWSELLSDEIRAYWGGEDVDEPLEILSEEDFKKCMWEALESGYKGFSKE